MFGGLTHSYIGRSPTSDHTAMHGAWPGVVAYDNRGCRHRGNHAHLRQHVCQYHSGSRRVRRVTLPVATCISRSCRHDRHDNMCCTSVTFPFHNNDAAVQVLVKQTGLLLASRARDHASCGLLPLSHGQFENCASCLSSSMNSSCVDHQDRTIAAACRRQSSDRMRLWTS